jgi:hypothetical protein
MGVPQGNPFPQKAKPPRGKGTVTCNPGEIVGKEVAREKRVEVTSNRGQKVSENHM